ncbi:MAG TPA: 50S ribosomal protein L4 [Myxococcota bacterium]|nr:50S ribosomal protein L4 [Myxococcota bacterium]
MSGPTVDVVTLKNAKADTLALDPSIFAAPLRPRLLHAEVRRQLARRRAGTHSTKNRHTVSGGGAKPWRQKGTGRARQGSTRSPQWAGGGVVFGPVPRSHEHVLPKKVRRAALRSALSLRAQEGALKVVDAFELDAIKTKRVVEILKALGLGSASVLVVVAEPHGALERSARNLPRVGVIRAEGLNVHDVLRHSHLLFTRAALELVQERLTAAVAARRES